MVVIDGNKLKRMRESRYLTQRELAKEINVAVSTLCRWESEATSVRNNNALALCRVLGCKKKDLEKGEEVSDKDIKRNADGYYDPTAYQAIKACDGKEGREILRGEIYEYMSAKGEYRTALVVGSNDRANDRVISVLLLSEEQRGKYTVPVVCGQMMYTHCDMVSYAFEDRLGNYVRTATDAEMEAVDNMMADALGLNIGASNAWKAEIDKLVEECARLSNEKTEIKEEAEKWKDSFYAMRSSRDETISEYEKEMSSLRGKLAAKEYDSRPRYYSDDDTIRIQVERDMYKMFYEDIIRGGGVHGV